MKFLEEQELHKLIIYRLSGGNKKVTYNFGYTYNDDKAIVLNSSYKRHLLNFKADYKITKKLKAGD